MFNIYFLTLLCEAAYIQFRSRMHALTLSHLSSVSSVGDVIMSFMKLIHDINLLFWKINVLENYFFLHLLFFWLVYKIFLFLEYCLENWYRFINWSRLMMHQRWLDTNRSLLIIKTDVLLLIYYLMHRNLCVHIIFCVHNKK